MEIGFRLNDLTTPRILYTFLSSPLFQPFLNLLIPTFTKSLMRHSVAFESASYIVCLKQEEDIEKERKTEKKNKRQVQRGRANRRVGQKMYPQLKAFRSCSFHGPIRLKSILPPPSLSGPDQRESFPRDWDGCSTWMIITFTLWPDKTQVPKCVQNRLAANIVPLH